MRAKVLAAINIPLIPILVPPAATACQLCAGVPGTHVAVSRPTVGTVKLTSPTSVDPPASSSLVYALIPSTNLVSRVTSKLLAICSANIFSSLL